MNDKKLTANCRFLDKRRRTVIPMPALEEADITANTMLEWTAVNGCVIGSPIVGMTIRQYSKKNGLIRKGVK